METENNLKYIIYLTTNLVNNKIYIGLHKTYTPYEFDGYLGCGVRVGDKHTYIHCNTPFESAVNKYGVNNFKRETLFVFDTLEEAIDKEKELVDEEFIKRKDTYNVALGGGVPPIITKTVYQFTLEGEFIKEWCSITEAAHHYNCNTMSISRAVLDKTPSLGFLWSDYKQDVVDTSLFKINANKNKVYVYTSNGSLYKVFESQNDCAEFFKVYFTTISKAVKTTNLFKKKYYLSLLNVNEFKIPIKKTINKVYQYDLNGNYLKEWDDISLNNSVYKSKPSIIRSIELNQAYKGFLWRGDKVDQLQDLPNATRPRKVGKFTLDGKLIKTFNTVIEAKKDTVGAPMVLTGKRKTAGGHVFKYI